MSSPRKVSSYGNSYSPAHAAHATDEAGFPPSTDETNQGAKAFSGRGPTKPPFRPGASRPLWSAQSPPALTRVQTHT